MLQLERCLESRCTKAARLASARGWSAFTFCDGHAHVNPDDARVGRWDAAASSFATLHGGGKYNTALNKLVDDGLVAKLTITRKSVLYGLDPAHPAALPIRSLLLKISELYNFETPTPDPRALEGGQSPSRRSRKRDARYTFGDPVRTLVLLTVYVLESAHMSKITRILGRFSPTSVRNTLWRFRAFGVLNAAGSPRGRKGIAFSLNPGYCFASEIRAVVASLRVALPHWETAIVRAAGSGSPIIRYKRRRGLNQKDAALKRWAQS